MWKFNFVVETNAKWSKWNEMIRNERERDRHTYADLANILYSIHHHNVWFVCEFRYFPEWQMLGIEWSIILLFALVLLMLIGHWSSPSFSLNPPSLVFWRTVWPRNSHKIHISKKWIFVLSVCYAPLFRLTPTSPPPPTSSSPSSLSSVGHVSNSRWIWYYLKLTCFRIFCLISWDRKLPRIWANICTASGRGRSGSFLSRKIN